MLLKINVGTKFLLNGKVYRVTDTSMEKCDRNGVSNEVSFAAVCEDTFVADKFSKIEVDFDSWTSAINEGGLKSMLTRG